jgi:hypothetical protein
LALLHLGNAALGEGDHSRAAAAFTEALLEGRDAGSVQWMGRALRGLARVAAADGRWERAMHLLGAAAAVYEGGPTGAPRPGAWLTTQIGDSRPLQHAHTALGEAAAVAAWRCASSAARAQGERRSEQRAHLSSVCRRKRLQAKRAATTRARPDARVTGAVPA